MSADDPDAAELRQEVEGLRTENEALRSSSEASRGGRIRRRLRRVSAWVVLVLACLLAVVSVFSAFIRNELLNTDTYVSTVAPLASNPAIQTAVAKRVSERLVSGTNLHQQVEQALPPKAGFLATPITSGLQTAADQIVLRFVESSAFQKLWNVANRRAHEQLVNVLTGATTGSVSTSNGQVTLDLSQVQAKVKGALDQRGITAFDKVPSTKAKFVLFQSKQLVAVQRLTRLFNHLTFVLPIFSLLLFAGAVLLTRNRRRGLVRAAAGLAISMAVLLVAASVGRNAYLNSLPPAQSKDAAAAVIDTVSAVLLDSVRTILIVALVVLVVTVLVGNKALRARLARARRPSWLTSGPFHDAVAGHRVSIRWGVLVLGLLVLVVWNRPTILVAVVVVLVTLALAGLVGVIARAPAPDTPGTEDGSRGSEGPGGGTPSGASTEAPAVP